MSSVKAVILSAGQGSRLLPLTKDKPKCLVEVGGRTVLDWQIEALAASGVKKGVVVAGFQESMVREHIEKNDYGNIAIKVRYNPFYQLSDNLATCWMVRDLFDGPTLLINGDTLFSKRICTSLLEAPKAAITVTIDRKNNYDSDDMKTILDGEKLKAIGKTLDLDDVDGEAIGMIRFLGKGGPKFRKALVKMMRKKHGVKKWYLSAVDRLAQKGLVTVHSIEGMPWGELDDHADLEIAEKLVKGPDYSAD